MKIDGEIVALASKSSNHCQIGTQPSGCVRAADDDDFVEVRVCANDGRRLFFDDICDVRVWIMPADSADGGSREHDIADEPQPDQI